MTELDAPAIGALDAQQALTRLRGPEQALSFFGRFLLHRAGGMEDGAARTLLQDVLRYPAGNVPSEQIATALTQIVQRLCQDTPEKRPLPFEDIRAILAWALGDASNEGFLQIFLRNIPDSKTEEALEHCRGLRAWAQEGMDALDRSLLNRATPLLTRAEQGLLRGLALEARWATEGGDGETARHALIRARALTRKFAGRGARARQFLAG